jgi:hypothetical protein
MVGVEYDYDEFENKNQSNAFIQTTGAAVGAPAFYSENIRTQMQTVTVRASYLFGPQPLVARY